jgi:hypothetical protein
MKETVGPIYEPAVFLVRFFAYLCPVIQKPERLWPLNIQKEKNAPTTCHMPVESCWAL